MVAERGIAAARGSHVAPAERALLESRERPIVLLRKRDGVDDALPGVAPGLAWLGAMLPYTPLQYLLFHEAAGRPAGTAWLADAAGARPGDDERQPGRRAAGRPATTRRSARLAGIADAFLVHDRDIVIRCDDSVVRAACRTGPQFIRRARGYTPRAIRLAAPGPPVVAVGGYFKNTVCVTRGDEAFVSQHIGDLDNAPTCAALEEAVAHLVAILDVEPALVAHDLHPDFFSTRHAARLAARWGVPLHAVQHHHAHIAAVAAEHRVDAPVLGLALDGVGLGTDGAAWGGELLHVDGARCERLGQLAPLRLPGGDRAAREPWRMAAAALARAGRAGEIARASPTSRARRPWRRCSRAASTRRRRAAWAAGSTPPRACSACGDGWPSKGRRRCCSKGSPSATGPSRRSTPVRDRRDQRARPDARSRCASPRSAIRAFGAALFHATLVAALAEWVTRAAEALDLTTVACGGGCFLNAILARGLRAALDARNLTMLEAQAVPPNDGGLALGQAWVAAARLGAAER